MDPKDTRETETQGKGIDWCHLVAWVITTLAAALAGWLHGHSCTCRGPELPPPPPFRADAEAAELLPAVLPVYAGPGDFGWVGPSAEDLRGVKRLRDTPAGQGPETDDDPDVFLWLAAIKVTGKPLPARDQRPVGSCVAFGNTCAHEYLECMQVAHGRAEQFVELCQESLYGLMRHQVGQDRIRGDGGVGIWAAQAAKDYGVLARGKSVGGKYDLTKYDGNRCRQWGRSGPPAELLPLVREHPVKDFAQCQSADDCRHALRAGYPIAVCSGQGFSGTRDADGFARADRSWSHCLAILGYRGGARRGFYIENSWGPTSCMGPTYPAAGDPAAPPDGGFWADWSVVDRMARQNGTFAFSDLVGFPAANPWHVQRTGPGRRWCRQLLTPWEGRRAA